MNYNSEDFKQSFPAPEKGQKTENKPPEQLDDFTNFMNPNLMSFSPPLFSSWLRKSSIPE